MGTLISSGEGILLVQSETFTLLFFKAAFKNRVDRHVFSLEIFGYFFITPSEMCVKA